MSSSRRAVAQRGRTVHSTITAEKGENNHQDIRHVYKEFQRENHEIVDYGQNVADSDDDGES